MKIDSSNVSDLNNINEFLLVGLTQGSIVIININMLIVIETIKLSNSLIKF